MLAELFAPAAVAVVGASREEGKVGHELLDNIRTGGFKGRCYPVNPNAKYIHGVRAYPSVLDIPGRVDLAVIAVPAPGVAEVLRACGSRRVKAAIVVSAGFKETGPAGMRLEREIAEVARSLKIRMVGPNCLGVIDTGSRLNASFSREMPARGRVSFMSQSGALATAILDWAKPRGLGFAKFVSLGNKADLTEVDFLNAWAEDPRTDVVAAYLESTSDGRGLMRAARRVSAKKPVIVLKSGTTDAGARAASSHTGALAGSERIYQAAFRQSHIIAAHSIEELFGYAVGLSGPHRVLGRRVAVVTNAGGPAVMASDAIERAGLQMAVLSDKSLRTLRGILPAASSGFNPIDLLGDANAKRYREALSVVAADRGVDALLVIVTPQAMTQIEQTAEAIVRVSRDGKTPVFAAMIGDWAVAPGMAALRRHQVPAFTFPEQAVASILSAARYTEMRREKRSTAVPVKGRPREVARVLREAGSVKRRCLVSADAWRVLAAYGLRVPRHGVAESAAEAVGIARDIGWPVAAKIASADILHKTDIGAVRLNVTGPSELKEAYKDILRRAAAYMPDASIWGVTVQEMAPAGREVILGVTRDGQFGPVIMYGLGGVAVEAFEDVAFRVLPISRGDALEMIQETRSSTLLGRFRGQGAADVPALVDAMMAVSALATDFPQMVEMDVNPLILYERGRGLMAVDAGFCLVY